MYIVPCCCYNYFMRKSQDTLAAELHATEDRIKVGGLYRHFKDPDHTYTVIFLAIDEDSEVCVVYKAHYGKQLTFVRSAKSWLDTVESNGTTVQRFTLIN
jgi:hypothetical protein